MSNTIRAPGSGTQSIERTVSLLRELATMGIHGARLVDLASRTNLEYPTAHRILRCPVKHKLVEKHTETRRYALGPLVFELGLAAIPRTNLREICEPMMRSLAEQTGDTVFLNVRSGLDAVCIDRREGIHISRLNSNINKALLLLEVQERMAIQGAKPSTHAPDDSDEDRRTRLEKVCVPFNR